MPNPYRGVWIKTESLREYFDTHELRDEYPEELRLVDVRAGRVPAIRSLQEQEETPALNLQEFREYW